MRLPENLRDRCKKAASSVIKIFISLPKNREEVQLIAKQMIRFGTSVASHAREASRARSNSEFCSKIDVLLQEADETQLWLELLIEDCSITNPALKDLHQELSEIIAIFTTIVKKTRDRGER